MQASSVNHKIMRCSLQINVGLIFDNMGTYLPVFYVHLVGYLVALLAVTQLRTGQPAAASAAQPS